VNEWAWEVVEEPADGRLVIRYSAEAPLFVAERETEEPARWRLVRRDLWPVPA
jgi:hypothetical protein